MLIFINRISMNFDKSTRKIVAQSLVLSLINYCIGIWGLTNKSLLFSVQKLQHFSAKVAYEGARKYDYMTLILKELKWLIIKDKSIFEKCTTMYKSLNGLYPECYLQLSTVMSRKTHHVYLNNLYVPKHRTDSCARAITVLFFLTSYIFVAGRH